MLRLPTAMLSGMVAFMAGGWFFSTAQAADGKALYLKLCAPCHGPEGRPNAKIARLLGVRDLTKSRIPDAEIERQVLEGRTDGQKQVMPAFKDSLTKTEVKALAEHVRQLRRP